MFQKLSIFGVLAMVGAGPSAQAATEVWTTGAGTANWSTSGNWTGPNLPPLAADSLTFGATTGVTTLNNDYAAATSFGTLLFSAGAATYTLGGNGITLTGAITNNGTVNQTVNLAIDMAATRTINTAAGGGDVTLGGLLSGVGGLTKSANLGTLTLNGSVSNTYTGQTSVSGGTLMLDFANMAVATNLVAGTSTLQMGGGILNVKGKSGAATSQTLGNVTQNGTTASTILVGASGGGSTTLNLGTLGHSAGSVTLIDISSTGTGVTTTSSNVNGLLNASYLVKDATGTGLATKSGSNVVRYDDTTGTVLSGAATAAGTNYTTLGAGASVTMAAGAQSLNSLAVDTTGGAQVIDLGTGIKTIASTGVLFRGSNNATLSNGQLGGNNAETIVHQLGTGKLTVSGTVGSGTASLVKNGSGELVLSGANTYTGGTRVQDGTLTVDGSLGATAVIVGSNVATTGVTPVFTIGATGSITGGSLSLLNPNAVATVNGTLSSTTTLTLTAGTLNINSAQTRTGNVAVNAGFTLGLGDAGGVGTATIVLGGGTLRANNGPVTLTNTVTNQNANSIIGGSQDLNLNGTYVNLGSGTLTVTNTGTTTFGGVSLPPALALRDTGTATRSLTMAGTGNVVFNSAITNGTSLNGTLSLTGSGTTTLNGANSYSGTTGISNGTVKLGNNAGLGFGGISSVAGNTTVNNAGTLDLNGTTVNEAISINGAGVGGGGSLVNSNTGTTAVIENGLAAVGVNAAGSGYIDGTYALTITGTGTGATANAVVAGGVVVSVQVLTAGTGYTGNPTISLTGAGTPVTAATFNTLASTLAMGSASTIGGAGHITVNSGLNGGSPLTKIGAGTLTLNGSNGYTGSTTVTAGTLLINGTSTATSSIALGSATLGGGGSTTGLVTTAGLGSHLAPGSAGTTGTLTLSGGLNALAGTTLDFQLGTASDLLSTTAFTGSSAANGLVFNFSDVSGFAAATTYTLMTFTSRTNLEYSDLLANLTPAGYILDSSFGTGGFLINANNLQVQFSAVPEPSTYVLLAGGIGFLLVLRRQKKKTV